MQLPILPERPKAETLTVEEILEHARRGRLRVPRFQTALRWEAKHVVELFDSIVRGFPIGGLLLWKRSAPAETLTFGPVSTEAQEDADALYVVDGQQRITALVGALSHPGSPPLGDTYAVWVDLRTATFQTHRRLPEPTWLPLNVLGSRARLHQWARQIDLGEPTEALVARAFDLEAAIMRYPVPATSSCSMACASASWSAWARTRTTASPSTGSGSRTPIGPRWVSSSRTASPIPSSPPASLAGSPTSCPRARGDGTCSAGRGLGRTPRSWSCC